MAAANMGASTIVKVLGDTSIKEDLRLKAAQELAETFESNVNSPGYAAFLDMTMKTFLKVLQEGECHFFADFNIQQMRKLILEMIHRLPVSEVVRPYVKSILTLMLKLLKTDNEDNVLVCLRIIIDLHKQYRPTFHPEIQHFIAYVRNIYSDLPKNLNKIFEPRDQIRVKDLKEINLEQLLGEIYSVTTIYVEKQEIEGKAANSFTLLPRGVNSLKVLQELPIILVLMYQIYKQSVHQEIVEFIPLIMTTIALQPSPVHRAMPNFNREIFVDFMSAQIKALSFLAYIVRTFLAQFQEVINAHATQMVDGMISLLRLCPMEVASTRKELLVATRHILATDLRNKFVSSIELLFDEDLLLGRCSYSNESLKPLAYSTLADLIHHVRQHLKLDILTKAVYLFSKNVHDESLPTSIQTMSCKLLLNLVDCIRVQRNDDSTPSPTPRELLMTMLKVFTLKFQTIAKLQLPLIMQKWKNLNTQAQTSTVDFNKEMIGIDVSPESINKLTSIGFPTVNTLNVCEYKSLVKTLICGVKTITFGINLTDNTQQKMPVTFQPEELLVFIDLFKWALEALDIYMINIPSPGTPAGVQQKTITQLPRSKDEKELLEHFSGLFLTMSPQNFQEIFSSTIDFMVDRISQNVALQVIANSFLASPTTSPLFATVLIEYLLERMEEMGSNIERSNLYLRLFKLVFGSVSLFANQNEQMLRPHLHNIVNRSMDLAMTAKEPYNYFLLLRALFRSIGGGSHDKLYKEFLPLLPNLLEGLNRLQSGYHKQHMKDLFVELCLTVPVRLSSLLPYLPMLMDPLVSALNGSPTLVNQGLRTLELCVDNLQPDFLYDHIQPVRAELMQALWKTLRNTDTAALVAFRVLGKFGGGNRKMMIEPQRLEYNQCNSKESSSSAIVAYFQEQRKPIDFPVDKVIETAFNALKTSSTDPYYWAQSWEIIRCYLSASICLSDEKHILQKLFTHPSFTEGPVLNINLTSSHFIENQARKTHQTALTAMFVAAATKELRQSVLPVFVDVVRHYTMVAIAQQAGPFPLKQNQQYNNIDPLVLIDALATIMGHEEKELCKAANFAMILIIKTATTIMGSKERACRLAMMQYLAEKMSNLCYERPWYAKLGGVIALKFLCEHMSMRWLFQHLYTFLKAYLFVIMDLTGEVSSGAISMAREYLANMLNICMVPLTDNSNEELVALQRKATFDVTHELVRRITSPHQLVRETAMDSLKQIATLQKITVTEVMMPHKEVLEDIVPPKKHLLKHQPAGAQIGLMDAFSFTSMEPRLFTLDLNLVTHKFFFHEVITLAEVDDVFLSKLDCFKNINNLIPLRKSALRALASCHYLGQERKNVKEKIFTILYKALEKSSELQETAFECMQKFNLGSTAEKEFLLQNLRPLLLALGDHRNLTINIVKRLSYLTQLFPAMFNEKLCDQLLEIIKKMLQSSVTANKNQNFLKVSKTGETEVKIATIIEIFHQIPAASAKFAPSLISLVLAAEKEIMIEPSSPYRAPLIKFLKRYPEDTVEIFLNEINIKNPQYNRFLIYLLKHKDGAAFVSVIEKKEDRLVELILKEKTNQTSVLPEYTPEDENEAQHQAILLIYTLTEITEKWIDSQVNIINALTLIWSRELGSSLTSENITCDLWHLVGKILLRYFEGNPSNIKLLYELLKAFCVRFIPDFQFLRDFIQNTVCQTYSVEWKRNAFFLFVEFNKNPMISVDLKVKIVTMIIIPSFAVSFDNGHGEELIGAPAAIIQNPQQPIATLSMTSLSSSTSADADDENIVSVFVNKVIEPEKSIDDDDDALRIALLQFACLLVERSAGHIHDGSGTSTNKKEGNKLRRLMTYAWPCLLAKNYVDPSARYHGHLLLAHIISKLAINKRIVLQVFHSLLKAHAVDARNLVRQALEIITPALPFRMDDGNQMLTHWTRKIILEEGHSMQQLNHILQLIVRHYKVYYPVRHQLVQQMISSMNRLGFSPNSSVDYRKLAVELAEVVIKWELQRIREETDGPSDEDPLLTITEKTTATGAVKRSIQDDDGRKKPSVSEPATSTTSIVPPHQRNEDYYRPIDRVHCDAVLNFLFRLSCQLGDLQPQIPGIQSPSEGLSRRCVMLIKRVMDQNVWLSNCDLKLQWLDKIFISISTEPTQANIGNICTALELLTYLLGCMRRDQLLAIFRPLQRGLSVCVTNHNAKIIKMMHALLTKLMSIFSPEHKHSSEDHLDQLYATISKTIFDGLTQFEKNPKANPSSLFGTLMILKAACTNNQSYIDRLIVPFMHVLDRLKKEHIGPINQQSQPTQQQQQIQGQQQLQQGQSNLSNSEITLELLILSLDLVKNRVIVMGVDLRKMFIGTILVGLIEKSTDPKVIRAIIKMIEEWMKNKNTPVTVLQAPTLREKSILLVKLMHYVEKRFSDDAELNAQFLELVNFIYRDDQLKVSELTSKLEQAFLAGLRCSQPHIRSKFFEVFDGSMRRKLHDRLLYIVCSHSWDSIQHHYWIKQCIELLLLTTNTTHSQIKNSNENHLLPSITSVINQADSEEKNNFVIYTSLQPEQHEMNLTEDKEDAIDMEMNVDNNIIKREESERPVENRMAVLCKLLNRESEFLDNSRKIKTEQFLIASSQLCHMDTQLAESVWLNVFPRLWSILDEGQQQSLDRELVAFLSSGTHVIQKDCNPSAINTFVEAFTQCQPPIYIPPSLMTYLGKSHNLWHSMTLQLENMALEWPNRKDAINGNEYRSEYDFDVELQQEIASSNKSDTVLAVLEPLSQMYSALYEEDLWAGLWQKHAKYSETNAAIFYEQMGHFDEAQKMYETAMTKFKQDAQAGNITSDMNSELLLWENHWIRCTKELNEWQILLDYGQSNKDKHAFLIMDSAWRVPDWNLMKQALLKVEQTSSKQMGHKVSLYRGYLAILNQEDAQHIPSVEKYVEISSALCMREWRRLPKVVSHIHLPILQSAQQIMELQEASQIHQQPLKVPDIKAVVKTWRNRLPVISDDLSHWSDIFTWRQHHYQIITDSMANCDLGPHASAQTIIQFGKVARKQNLTTVCHNLLSRIHTIPTVPVIDCFQKIRQEVKCFIQMANNNQDQSSLSEALEVIETTNIKYFKPELVAEIYALKGNLLKQMSKSDEANKAFSAAVQLSDVLPSAWGMWGNYLEGNFARDPKNAQLGLSAMVCFLHACRQQNESKTRKYFAKIIWLLTYEEKRSEMLELIDKYGQAIPPIQWLPWIPQLLNCLIQYEGDIIMNLLSNIARSFPQAVYFPIRTLYLMLKIEQRERYKSVEQAMAKNQQQASVDQQTSSQDSTGGSSIPSTTSNLSSQSIQIKASPPMYRCSKIMHMQRDIHPTTLSSLEGIVDQMVWFRENWYEEVLRQLKQGLAKCYGIAFDNRGAVNEAKITPHTLNFVRKLVSTFGIGIENISNNTNIMAGSSASESLARRAQATVQDPVFQKLKGQFTSDFDFSQPDATKMQNLITKLKIWIKILDVKTKQLPKSFLIEEKCRFLSNFNQKTAEVDLPGELLLPRHSHYHVKIAKFMPRVEIVQKHNTSARRLFIQGTNGKIYPYLVVNDSGLADARREERVLQLLRMLNSYLTKYKETSKRFLHITVPRVVAVSPQMRLVEDDPSSISLLDVLKTYCSRLNIEYDSPITRYYERLAEIQQRGVQTTHATLRDIFKEIQINMVPKTVLKDWASKTFMSSTDYWTFRKMFTLQLSLWSIVEYAFLLTRLNPDMMYLHQDSGLINVSYFKFDLDDINGEMNPKRPVPFRLTPNIAEFITNMGILGPLSASIMATARCFLQPNYQIPSILKTILCDEIITIHRKHIINTKPIDPNEDLSQDKTFSEINVENVIQTVNNGVNQITERLNHLSNYDYNEGNKVSQLIQMARNPDSLCRMDPIWFPWM